jgi:hypothetical protein
MLSFIRLSRYGKGVGGGGNREGDDGRITCDDGPEHQKAA